MNPHGTPTVRTAVILPPSAASFFTVAGVPLLRRTALVAQRAGVNSVYVLKVSATDDARARTVLDADPRTRGVALVEADEISSHDDRLFVVLASDRLVTKQIFDSLPPQTATELLSSLKENDGVSIAPGDGGPGILLRSPSDVARAEQALLDEIRSATRDTDGPIARLDRALSLRVSRHLVRTAIRPNHITIVGTLIGLVAAWTLAHGVYALDLLGAVLFWVAVIVDGCDGEVARLKFLDSRFGELFDIFTDNVVHVSLFIGLAVGAYRSGRVQWGPTLTTALIVGFLCASAATYVCLLSRGPVRHLETATPRGRLRRGMLHWFEALMNRDFAYLLLVLAIVDRLHWFVVGTVLGTYAYAAALVWVYRWDDGVYPTRQAAVESPQG